MCIIQNKKDLKLKRIFSAEEFRRERKNKSKNKQMEKQQVMVRKKH